MDTPQIKEFFGNKEFELLYDLILPELSDKEGEKNRRRIDKNHFELIKKWEELREKEPVKISFYCQSIKDEFQKSKDGWAESIRLLLTDPKGLNEEYDKLLSGLGYDSVNSTLKSVETKFERLKKSNKENGRGMDFSS